MLCVNFAIVSVKCFFTFYVSHRLQSIQLGLDETE